MAMLLMPFGMVVKGLGIAIWHVFRPRLLKLLTVYDPVGVRISELVLSGTLDMRGIAPPAAAIPAFEALLVLAFGVECFVVGLFLLWVRKLCRYGGSTVPTGS
jgi:hypothetical protein